jgi:hypothetical protein
LRGYEWKAVSLNKREDFEIEELFFTISSFGIRPSEGKGKSSEYREKWRISIAIKSWGFGDVAARTSSQELRSSELEEQSWIGTTEGRKGRGINFYRKQNVEGVETTVQLTQYLAGS